MPSAKVWKVEFKELSEGGALRTPRAEPLKALRGQLLRESVTHRLENVEQLLALESDTFMADTTSPLPPSTIRFLV